MFKKKSFFSVLLNMANHITLCIWLLFFFISIISLAKSETYIIHMDFSAMPKAFSSHHNWYLTTLSSVSDSSTNYKDFLSSKLVYSYTNAIHGFSASLSPSELEAIKNSPGYVSSIKDISVKIDTTHTSQFLGLNSESGVWPTSEYGKDIIIGLVDTGIWSESKSYSDDGISEVPSRWKGECESGTEFNSSLCNKKLIGARYFNKGLLANNPNLNISMNSARDTDGHGTHTSSTAAGSYVEGASYFGYATGTAIGIAPKAHVAMYKALWEEGVYLSDVLAAIDQAITDGVDVLSLSLGIDAIPLHEDPVAIAAFAALEKGIFVSTSAGNEGPYYETLHNGTPWVLTVAAGTVDREFIGTLTLGNGVSVTGLSLYPGNSSSSESSIVYVECQDDKELQKNAHKFVVCLDKNDSVGEHVYNVRNSKVAGAVFITNTTDLEFYLQSEFPAVFLNLQEGDKVLEYIKSNSAPKGKLEFQVTHIGAKRAPEVATYSSRGPSPSCPSILKPDLMAPGALILASWPQQSPVTDVTSGKLFSNFNIISGTSMSCPHASGVAALLKGAHPEWSPAAIRSAMMTTSSALDNTQSPIRDIGSRNAAATPLAMGAGHIDPNKALDPGLIYDATPQDYVNLLCALNFTSKQIKIITRSSSYTCSNPSLDLNYPSFIGFFNGNSRESDPKRIQEFKRTVTNLQDGTSVYTANLTPMGKFKVSVVPEKLVFKEKYEKLSYKLRIEGPIVMDDNVVYGSLSWVETGGKYVVRSPIVATSIKVDPLTGHN
ncbi:subtilisin-like protease SBT3 [Nicotiana tabacum]|uniref:Subtilisin-like protease SBT1.9 n=1 Tax=Nicotiana tabacum TaxID=4097 RepID=A0A1S3ZQR1_TOBAC|nr:PREDICTED: subtilisin-like protease SBT1.9 [Nicotiana tabacum]